MLQDMMCPHSCRTDLKRSIADEDFAITINFDGTLTMSYPYLLSVYCKMIVSDFPYDSQTCQWADASMLYDSSALRLTVVSTEQEDGGEANAGTE